MKIFNEFCGAIILVIFCSSLCEGSQKCGEKWCDQYDYCTVDKFCKACSSICDRSSHNYEEVECKRYCQDYLYYIRSGGDSDLRVVVQKLHSMVVITLTLVCFILVIIGAVICLQVYRWKNRKNVTLSNLRSKLFAKKTDNNANKSPSIPANQTNGKSDLRLEIPTTGTQSDHSPVTATTSISRRPAEDSALDYAYDNPAMSNSTSKSNNPHESAF